MTKISRKALLLKARCRVRQNSQRVITDAFGPRWVALFAGVALMLFVVSALLPALASEIGGSSGQPMQTGNREAAVVNGHHVQPRRGDAPAPAPDQIEQLYRELMDATAPDKLRDLDGTPLKIPRDSGA